MWVSKPIYESLPYFYLISGAAILGASLYVNHGFWPTVCFVAGLFCLVAGLVVLLKRRDYRITDRRVGQRPDY
jgi:polyferredoxin